MRVTAPSTCSWLDHSVSGLIRRTERPVQTRFRYAYTYRLKGYPAVEAPWYDRDVRSWKYPTTVERRAYMVGADAGYLIQAAVS